MLLTLVSLARVELAPHMETRLSTLRVYLFHHSDLRGDTLSDTFRCPTTSKHSFGNVRKLCSLP